jgi:hypothetical protein
MDARRKAQMSNNRSKNFNEVVFEDIWEELSSLEGEELDAFLINAGLNPNELLAGFERSLAGAMNASKRARFDEARKQLRMKKPVDASKILSFDLSKKRQIAATLKVHADKTKELTIAARNQKLDDEGDLDSFLEAFLRLGLIDSDGNLKS